MPSATAAPLPETLRAAGAWVALGDFLRRRRAWVHGLQWCVVLGYAALVALPAFLPLPPEDSHIWNNLTRFAQFAFWGVWWPGVMLATVASGRTWCGLFCPEGALSEWASRRGLGKPVPRWIKWGGWPFVAFLGTTIYGQLVSVYEYPQPALLVLGGSTVAAVVIGLLYGKGHRVWCRHLCPANGVFGLLAKIAPLHYRVDRVAWDSAPAAVASGRKVIPLAPVDCAPLVDIRRMKSASDCHACGRCSGHRGAVRLAPRAPWREILDPAAAPAPGEVLTLFFAVMGVATMAFQWSSSPWFLQLKLAAAEWLVEHGHEALLQDNAPWWLLTHVPAANDVFTWLDGALILLYLVGGGFALGALLMLPVWVAARLGRVAFGRLAMALVPLAATSVVLGLSMLTISHLKAEHVPLAWLSGMRIALLALGAAAPMALAWALTRGLAPARRAVAALLFALAPALLTGLWSVVFFVW